MKLMIASDLHGSAACTRRLLEAYEREKPDALLLLGDILYHGPRNDLPEGYAPKDVISLLNGVADRILCVRGNCDTEVDQMVLTFPILQEQALIADGEYRIFLIHGHKGLSVSTPATLAEARMAGLTFPFFWGGVTITT